MINILTYSPVGLFQYFIDLHKFSDFIIMDNDSHSVQIKIPKQRRNTKWSKSISKKGIKVSEEKYIYKAFQELSDELLKYELPQEIPLPICQIKNDVNLLSYKYYSKEQNVSINKKKLTIPLQAKYKVISSDYKRRLYMNYFPEKVGTVLDFDEDFYNCINGRPLKYNYMQHKSFEIYLNRYLQLRQQIGYLKDFISNVGVNYKKEIDIYEKSLRKLSDQANYFEQFISEDYHKSMFLLEKGDKLVSDVNKIKAELEYLSGKKFTITSKLIGLDFKYTIQQKYGRFLYYLSPPLWRARNRDFARSIEIEAKGFDLGISSDEDAFIVIYEKMRKECCSEFIKPALYFTEPKHLMDVFETIEKQQLHHFAHVSHFSPYTKTLNENIISFKHNMNEETLFVSGAIKDFKNLLESTEQRCMFLKNKFFKTLHGLFYDSVGSSAVLKNLLHLEFCYEEVYGEKPINRNIKAVAEALELFYMEYSMKLELIHNDRINDAIQVCVESEQRKARNAVVAAKELRLYYRLERELLRAHDLPYDGPSSVPVQKTVKKKPSKNRTKQEVRVNKIDLLMEDQKEHSMFFTDLLNNDEDTI